jgi:hypothetical protein
MLNKLKGSPIDPLLRRMGLEEKVRRCDDEEEY